MTAAIQVLEAIHCIEMHRIHYIVAVGHFLRVKSGKLAN